MKLSLFLLSLVVFGVFGGEFTKRGPGPFQCDGSYAYCKVKELGHHIQYHASTLGSKLYDVGRAVLADALDKGSNLLLDGAQAAVGAVLNHLQTEGIIGKRELNFDSIITSVNDGMTQLAEIKDDVSTKYKETVAKLVTALKDVLSLKMNADILREVDEAVAKFTVEAKRGFLKMADVIKNKLHSIFSESVSKVTTKRAIIDDLLTATKGKLSDLLSTVQDKLNPHYQSLTSGVNSLAEKIKSHAVSLVNVVGGSDEDFKQKMADHFSDLNSHIDELSGHSETAVNALKEAIAAVAAETISNVKGTAGKIINTGKAAAGTLTDHLKNKLMDTINN